jgi:hypothetical protein
LRDARSGGTRIPNAPLVTTLGLLALSLVVYVGADFLDHSRRILV